MPTPTPVTPELIQLNIRVPADIDAALEKAAQTQRRSKNAQAVVILEEWLKRLEIESAFDTGDFDQTPKRSTKPQVKAAKA